MKCVIIVKRLIKLAMFRASRHVLYQARGGESKSKTVPEGFDYHVFESIVSRLHLMVCVCTCY